MPMGMRMQWVEALMASMTRRVQAMDSTLTQAPPCTASSSLLNTRLAPTLFFQHRLVENVIYVLIERRFNFATTSHHLLF